MLYFEHHSTAEAQITALSYQYVKNPDDKNKDPVAYPLNQIIFTLFIVVW